MKNGAVTCCTMDRALPTAYAQLYYDAFFIRFEGVKQ